MDSPAAQGAPLTVRGGRLSTREQTSADKMRRLTQLGQYNYLAPVGGDRLSPREQTSVEEKRRLTQPGQNKYLAPVRGGRLPPWEQTSVEKKLGQNNYLAPGRGRRQARLSKQEGGKKKCAILAWGYLQVVPFRYFHPLPVFFLTRN